MRTQEITSTKNGHKPLYDSHAIEQMQRRGLWIISLRVISLEFLENYAMSERAPGNAKRFYITKNSVELALKDKRISPQEADKLINCVYVYVMDLHLIKTAYKQERGRSGVRKTQRGNRNRKNQRPASRYDFYPRVD